MSRENPNPPNNNKNDKNVKKTSITNSMENDEELRIMLTRPDESTDYVSSLILEMSNAKFFHGSICSIEASECLKNDGDFLLRTPADTSLNQILLSVYWKGRVFEFPLRFSKTGGQPIITLNGTHSKGTIQDLLRDHSDIPIEGSIRLRHPTAKTEWQLPLENVELDVKIGEGAFGSVWRGRLKDPKTASERVAAIKVTKECDSSKRNEILVEAKMMSLLNHANVVGFYGVALDSVQVMIVMELIDGGSLDKYLRKNSDITDGERGSFCFDIACGLRYLHSRHYLHRDVACRNCLINEGTQMIKISDFGMSKHGITYKISATERTPIRWQAPEVMRTAIYSLKCDVYSYGMTMYEVFSGGNVPFVGIDNKIIRQKIHEPSFRPRILDDWPVEVKAVMQYCWEHQPDNRPTMDAIASVLKIFARHRNPRRNANDSPSHHPKKKPGSKKTHNREAMEKPEKPDFKKSNKSTANSKARMRRMATKK